MASSLIEGTDRMAGRYAGPAARSRSFRQPAAAGHHRRVVRSALTVAAVVVLLLGVITGLLWGFQRKLIYLPDAGPAGSADDVVPGAEDVVLRTTDGLELAAWYVPGRAPDAVTVLVANGNGGHRGVRAPLARALSDAGLAV